MDGITLGGSCRLIRAKTDDGLWLQGLAFEPGEGPFSQRRMAVLHVHGLAGNFYENPFVEREAEVLASMGIAMFSVSTRGRDYEADFLREVDGTLVEERIGSARERLADSKSDIDGWIRAMKALGIREILLQGHSLGTLKAISYLAGCTDPSVMGCVLLSPADMFGIQREYLGSDSEWDRVLDLARGMVSRGEGGSYLPDGSFFAPTTAAAYLDKYGDGTWDILAIEDELQGKGPSWSALKGMRVPCLVLYGDTNEAVVGNRVVDAVRVLERIKGPMLECRIIPGADHIYRGAEEAMAQAVGDWIGKALLVDNGNR